MGCPRCTARQLVEISVRLAGERTVTLHSCSRCETKWWDQGRGSEVIELDDVLSLATVRR